MNQIKNDPLLLMDCQTTLLAIEKDPLRLSEDIHKHIAQCRACSEARTMWLAQEDFEAPVAPAGYFDRLPARVLQKLPAPPKQHHPRLYLLASAASLMLIVATVGYWFGRSGVTQPIVLEAVIPPGDIQDFYQDPTSFTNLELYSQVPYLTQDEIADLVNELKKPEASVQPVKPVGD